uniref:Uncharacterized protein n=1 Tax=Alexandrium catenella TaxID=2925 RepID=A0A7S1S8J0_ALECA|mmetsp:Transcript_90016/g.239151  ORF Transcript_90016/g.239151 Transcript_90016/m.239151 type:complete len:211 (+) Transcript_90016:125-757(+)
MVHVPGLIVLALVLSFVATLIIPERHVDLDETVVVFRMFSSAAAFGLSVPTMCRNIQDGLTNGWSEKTVGRVPAQVCFMIPCAFLCLACVHRLKYDYLVVSPLARRLLRRCPCLDRKRCLTALSCWICFSGGLRFLHHWFHSDKKRQFGWDNDRILVSMGWIFFFLTTLLFETVSALLDLLGALVCLLARLADWCMGYRSNGQACSDKRD